MIAEAPITVYRPDDWAGALQQLELLIGERGGTVLVHCPPNVSGRAAALDILDRLGRPRAARGELATGMEWAAARAWLRATGTSRLILAGAWRASERVVDELRAISIAGIQVGILDDAAAPTEFDGIATGTLADLVTHLKATPIPPGCTCPERIVDLPAELPLLPLGLPDAFLPAALASVEGAWREQLHASYEAAERHLRDRVLVGHEDSRADRALLVQLTLRARTSNEVLVGLRALQQAVRVVGRELSVDAATLLALTDPWRGRSSHWCLARPWPIGRDPLLQALAALARSTLSAAQIAGLTTADFHAFPRVHQQTLDEHLRPAVRAALEYFGGWPQLSQVFLRVAVPRQHPEISGLLNTRPAALRRWVDRQAAAEQDAANASQIRVRRVDLDPLGAGSGPPTDDAVLLHVTLRDLGGGADLNALLPALGWTGTRLTQATRTLAGRLNHTGERLVQTPGRRLQLLTVDHPQRDLFRRAILRGPDLSYDASRLHATMLDGSGAIAYSRAAANERGPATQELLHSELLIEVPADQ